MPNQANTRSPANGRRNAGPDTDAARDRATHIDDSASHPTTHIVDSLSRAVLDGDPALDPGRSEDHLAIVSRAAAADQAGRELLRASVAAARGSGHSWAAIGNVLGLSRQAAQQRFGGSEAEASMTTTEPTRPLGPVTAFSELAELDLAGRQGWHTIGVGILTHTMVHTSTQWEHRRVAWRRPAAAYEADGWIIGARAFPWLYLIRDTGIPAQESV